MSDACIENAGGINTDGPAIRGYASGSGSLTVYYDTRSNTCVNGAELARRGLPVQDAEALSRWGVYPLTIEKPDYNPETEGIEPDGKPEPDPENPSALVQRMKVFDLLGKHKANKKDAASAKRRERETGGIVTPDGVRILTGITDQNRISTAIQGMRDSGITTVDFKAASGWTTLSLEALTSVGGLIAAHVQACFSRERELHEAIDACATLDDLNALDLDEGWPEYAAAEMPEFPPEKPEETPEGEEGAEEPASPETGAEDKGRPEWPAEDAGDPDSGTNAGEPAPESAGGAD